jgi:hypothetical protein
MTNLECPTTKQRLINDYNDYIETYKNDSSLSEIGYYEWISENTLEIENNNYLSIQSFQKHLISIITCREIDEIDLREILYGSNGAYKDEVMSHSIIDNSFQDESGYHWDCELDRMVEKEVKALIFQYVNRIEINIKSVINFENIENIYFPISITNLRRFFIEFFQNFMIFTIQDPMIIDCFTFNTNELLEEYVNFTF